MTASEIVPHTPVLGSLSKGQREQGFYGQFWGQELGEEGDYLIRTSGGKDFAKRVQTESEAA
jgi:hypothetical protein